MTERTQFWTEDEPKRLRGQIEEVASTGLSLMPEGIEQGIDPQGLADLIAYIRSLTARN